MFNVATKHRKRPIVVRGGKAVVARPLMAHRIEIDPGFDIAWIQG